MYKFSKRSKKQYDTIHPYLQLICKEAIKVYDFTIIQGYRSTEHQNKLYQQGRSRPGNIVTYIDGINNKSKHNQNPSLAVDLVPYPIDWGDEERFYHLAGIMKGIARVYGIDVTWGGDWINFKDYPHFELNKQS